MGWGVYWETARVIQVVIESPFAGDIEGDIAYARRCCRDSLERNEAPYASHLFYTQPHMLDDTNPEERELGMWVGFLWGAAADLTAVYVDRSISRGMLAGVRMALAAGKPIDIRSLADERVAALGAEHLIIMCPELLTGCWTISWRGTLDTCSPMPSSNPQLPP